MKLECPGCRNVLSLDDAMSGKSVRCSKCSAVVQVPASESAPTAVTAAPPVAAPSAPPADTFADRDVAEKVTPATRPRDWGDEEQYPERRPRPQPASSGSGTLVLILLLAVGLPFLLVIACVGLGAASFFWRAKEANREMDMVEVAPAMAMPDEEVIRVDGPGLVHANKVAPEAILGRPERLNEFIAENLRPNDQIGPLAPDAKIWARISAGVVENRLVASPLVKGDWGNVVFRETGPDNGILIGFFASVSGNGFVDYMQPIYLTPKGEKIGKQYGSPNGRVVCVKAKEGYAVGAIDVHSRDLFHGFQVTFIRVAGEALNVNDSYRAAHVGDNGGDQLRVSGTGALIVGIHGRSLAQANVAPAGSITSLGVLSLK